MIFSPQGITFIFSFFLNIESGRKSACTNLVAFFIIATGRLLIDQIWNSLWRNVLVYYIYIRFYIDIYWIYHLYVLRSYITVFFIYFLSTKKYITKQTNIHVEFKKYHFTNKCNLKNNKYGTKNTESDQTYSPTSTSTVISNKKNVSRPTDNTSIRHIMGRIMCTYV